MGLFIGLHLIQQRSMVLGSRLWHLIWAMRCLGRSLCQTINLTGGFIQARLLQYWAADKPPKLQERDFSGTAYVPVYVMLPLGVINMDCQLVDQDNLLNQVVMSFHECGGNVGDDVHIPLPQWLTAIGQRNPDIFFTDKKGRHNPECLTWGIDKERILRGETVLDLQSLSKVKQHQVSSDEILGSN
ncbi:beta-amylase 7-like isoform X4 [Camellia sinensis]|uniref:beta-amylase 7-like isoform X4 n=1 Tax=Camellia sinensis TaxID=4442 RepID=UPI0010365CF0|nr:beta-amylase 7-like isoform X4 [Camellia sinensis]